MRTWVLLFFCVGCNEAPLSSCGTQRLTVTFPPFALDADQVQVGGKLLSHLPGAAMQTFQVALSDGENPVSLLRAGAVVTSGMVSGTHCKDAAIDLTFVRDTLSVPQTPTKNTVDLLFLVDDSTSMDPKQRELRARFPDLIRQLDTLAAGGHPAWYHIGVVTTDLGAGPGVNGGCRAGGLGARLQPLGRAHDPDCNAPVGVNFIDYNQLDGTNNLPAGQDLAKTFSCMAEVGTSGCGYEAPLEAVYRALHDCAPGADGSYTGCTIPENRGFLRNDSLLVVVLLTDEDDCSAPPDTDLFESGKTDYGPPGSYRCSRYGVVCGDQLLPEDASGGPLSDCHAAPNPEGAGPGKLYDVSRYVDFFRNQVRPTQEDVILVSLAAPPMPLETVMAHGGQPESLCSAPVDSTCQPALQHSCSGPGGFSGDPAVRISEVVRSVKNWQEPSICDADYSGALSGIGGFVANQLGLACLRGVVAGDADCVVRDVGPGGTTTLAECGQPPCWRSVESQTCPLQCVEGQASRRTAVMIDRGGAQPPAGTVSEITCTLYNHDQSRPQSCQ